MKKNRNLTNSDISELITNDYVTRLEYGDEHNIINKIPLLIDNGLAYTLTGFYDPYSSGPVGYRVICMIMQRYNKRLKDFRRKILKYEFGGEEDAVEPNTDKRLIGIAKYALKAGTYYTQLDDSQYCLLQSESASGNDAYKGINYNFYIIGSDWKKWLNKIRSEIDMYNDMLNDTYNEQEYIETSMGDVIETIFKPFDQIIMTDKDNLISYIDNWVNNIPVYHNKYNMIAKLSIMIHGDPGTGKSTVAKAIAKHLGITYVEQVGPDRFWNNDIPGEDGKRPRRRRGLCGEIYLIDDIDCICNSRKDDKSKENNKAMSALLSFLDNPPAFRYTCDGVLYPISIVIATTNYYDRLDPAVLRYGRFDLTIEMRDFNRQQAQEMCDVYELRLDDVIDNASSKDFTISPAKLQALCLEKVDKALKEVD